MPHFAAILEAIEFLQDAIHLFFQFAESTIGLRVRRPLGTWPHAWASARFVAAGAFPTSSWPSSSRSEFTIGTSTPEPVVRLACIGFLAPSVGAGFTVGTCMCMLWPFVRLVRFDFWSSSAGAGFAVGSVRTRPSVSFFRFFRRRTTVAPSSPKSTHPSSFSGFILREITEFSDRAAKLFFEFANFLAGRFNLTLLRGVSAAFFRFAGFILLVFGLFTPISQELTPHRLAKLSAGLFAGLAQFAADPIEGPAEVPIDGAPLFECRADLFPDVIQGVPQPIARNPLFFQSFAGSFDGLIPGSLEFIGRRAKFVRKCLAQFLEPSFQPFAHLARFFIVLLIIVVIIDDVDRRLNRFRLQGFAERLLVATAPIRGASPSAARWVAQALDRGLFGAIMPLPPRYPCESIGESRGRRDNRLRPLRGNSSPL